MRRLGARTPRDRIPDRPRSVLQHDPHVRRCQQIAAFASADGRRSHSRLVRSHLWRWRHRTRRRGSVRPMPNRHGPSPPSIRDPMPLRPLSRLLRRPGSSVRTIRKFRSSITRSPVPEKTSSSHHPFSIRYFSLLRCSVIHSKLGPSMPRLFLCWLSPAMKSYTPMSLSRQCSIAR